MAVWYPTSPKFVVVRFMTKIHKTVTYRHLSAGCFQMYVCNTIQTNTEQYTLKTACTFSILVLTNCLLQTHYKEGCKNVFYS